MVGWCWANSRPKLRRKSKTMQQKQIIVCLNNWRTEKKKKTGLHKDKNVTQLQQLTSIKYLFINLTQPCVMIH